MNGATKMNRVAKTARTMAPVRNAERGAILPIMALLLVALLTMAAIAVDLGAARETRRRNQGAVDAAAVSAAQDLPTPKKALQTAVSLAAENLGISPSQAKSALNSCSGSAADPLALAITATTTTAGANENCVSFDFSASQIRIYYHDTYKTAFGAVAGVKTLSINNGATAGKSPSDVGGVLPFGLAASGSGMVCLKTSSGGTATAPCGGGSAGNYGFLDVSQYGNTFFKTTYTCGNGTHDQRFQDNLAMGIDHDLLGFSQTTPAYSDVPDAAANNNYCPATPLAGPDHLAVETGNVDNIITAPLLTDVKGTSSIVTDQNGARLQRGNFVCTGKNIWAGWTYPPSGACTTIEGSSVDDVPLWHFIGNSTTHTPDDHTLTGDVPAACQYAVFTGILTADALSTPSARATDMRTLLTACFNEYSFGAIPPVSPSLSETPCTALGQSGCAPAPGCSGTPCTGMVFGYKTIDTTTTGPFDIQKTPRFGYAPVVCTVDQVTIGSSPPTTCPTPFGPGGKDVIVIKFAPVFIQRIMSQSGSGLDFEPGVDYACTCNNKAADEILGYAFPGGMLPPGLGDPNAPNLTDVNRTVSLIR